VNDAYVLSSAPDANYPYSGWLHSGSGPLGVYRAFARFPLPRRGQIVSAVLKMGFAGAESSLGDHLIDFVPDDAWTQTTLTWNDQPGVGERIATIERADLGAMSIDVTQLAQREQSLDGWLSLRVAGASEGAPSLPSKVARWWSRDDTNQRGFHLELTVSPAPEMRRGDVVVLSTGGLFSGVVAIDPSERVLRGVAPIRFVGPIGALGVDPRNGNLIGTDVNGLLRIDRLSGNPSSLSDLGPLWMPYRALAVSSDGHLYSTDEIRGVVRIELDSGARELVTSGDALCPPIAMALDGASLLVDDWCGRLVRIDLETGAQSVVSTGGPLYEPDGIAVEADGNILVADVTDDYGWSGRILRIDPASGTQTVLTELSFAPGAIAVGPTGTIWVASRATDSRFMGVFGRIDPQLGTYTEQFRNWEEPSGIAIDADGAPLVAYTRGYNDAYVVRFDPATGTQETIAAPLGTPWSYMVSSSPEDAHYHLFVDAHRQLLVVTDDRVMRVDPTTGVQTLIARIESAGCDPLPICLSSDVALAPDGRIVLLREVLAAGAYPRLVWIDPVTGDVTVQEVDWVLNWANRLAIETSGAILLNDFNFADSMIARYDPLTGQASPAFDLGDLVARIDDMALDAAGTLFVADTAGGEILHVDPVDGSTVVVGSSPAPGRIVVDARGRVFSWGSSPEKLLVLDPSTGSLTMLATATEVQANRTLAVLEPACADHLDDDGDGLVDLADPGCANARSPRENPQCNNGRDDDNDGRTDLDDPDCVSPASAEISCGLGAELVLALVALRLLRARIRPIRS
jgi:streptogramin lyase